MTHTIEGVIIIGILSLLLGLTIWGWLAVLELLIWRGIL